MLRAEPVQLGPAVDSNERAHRLLASANARRFAPRRSAGDFDAELEHEAAIRRTERSFVEAERAVVKAEARTVPTEPSSFVAWFESRTETPSAESRALSSWLASEASAEQAQWLNARVRAHDALLEDLLALIRVNMPESFKLELGRHWPDSSHPSPSPLFPPRAAVPAPAAPDPVVWQALAVENLMIALGTAPHYFYQALGALAVSRHSAAWNSHVLAPLVVQDPSLAPLIAEGALMRVRLVACRDARYLDLLCHSSAFVAHFEYAEDNASATAAPHVSATAPAVRPVQWRDVSARPTY